MPRTAILIGDRIETDIRMRIEAGMKTALLMTGVTDRKALAASTFQPGHIFDSLDGMEDLL